MRRSVAPFTAICLLALTTSPTAQVRADGLQCIRTYFGIKNDISHINDVEVYFKPNDATQILKDISSRFNFDKILRAISCDSIDNAIPYVPEAADKLPEPLASQTFIIYRRSWLRTVLGSNRDKAVFILGHELGHIMRGHIARNVSIPRLQMEKEADFDGACAVAKLGGTWSTLEDVITQNRDESDGDYPSVTHSLEIARKAFNDCGGSLNLINPSPSTKIVYWYKRADSGSVVNALNTLGIKADVRQSSVYKGEDFSDRHTDTITCHSGASVSLVRNIALALHDQGISVSAISQPDKDNALIQDRITLQSTSQDRPKLSRHAIENLKFCPSQTDPVYGSWR